MKARCGGYMHVTRLAAFSRRIVSGVGYPIEAFNIMLPKEQAHLPGMFLNVPHRI